MTYQGDVTLHEYFIEDGVPSITDKQIGILFEKLKVEGRLYPTFGNAPYKDNTAQDFINWMKNGTCILYVVLYKKRIVGAMWLDDLRDKSARLNYFMYRWVIKEGLTVHIARETLKQLLDIRVNGETVIEVIRGETPTYNKLGVGFLDKIGMVTLGEVPNAAYHYYKNKTYPMIMSYITRELLEE